MTTPIPASNNLPPLTFQPYSFGSGSPFEGDLLQRKELADKLSQFIPRLREGAVIAIDAPWGAGKTWFGLNWARQLRADGHKVACINAFEQDYTEDPFLPIAAELSTLLETGPVHKFLEKAATVAGALLPVATKIAIGLVTKAVLGSIDVPNGLAKAMEKVDEQSDEFVKHWVERKLEAHTKERESLSGFRRALADLASRQNKPVIVFIDELDRCRPDFAVRIIERIKHFFETPNIVFVLLVNRLQLQNAIQGVYGASTDGAGYLSKFIQFFFALPRSSLRRYIELSLGKLQINAGSGDGLIFVDYLEMWTTHASLSLRDVERAVALYAYASPNEFGPLMAYLVVLKIKKPDIYYKFLQRDADAGDVAKRWLLELAASRGFRNLEDRFSSYLNELGDLVGYVGQRGPMSGATGFRIVFPVGTMSREVPGRFMHYAQSIDFPLE